MLFLPILLSQYNLHLFCQDHTHATRPQTVLSQWGSSPAAHSSRPGLTQVAVCWGTVLLMSTLHRHPWITVTLVKPAAPSLSFNHEASRAALLAAAGSQQRAHCWQPLHRALQPLRPLLPAIVPCFSDNPAIAWCLSEHCHACKMLKTPLEFLPLGLKDLI